MVGNPKCDAHYAIAGWIQENYENNLDVSNDETGYQLTGYSGDAYFEIAMDFDNTEVWVMVLRAISSDRFEFANPAMFDKLAKLLDECGLIRKVNPLPPAPESSP